MKKKRPDGGAEPRETEAAQEEPGPEAPEAEGAEEATAGGPDGPEAESAGEPTSPELERLREELEELNERHLRLAAEFDNYRKRSQAELGSSGARAQAALVERLLDVMDDFRRVASLDPEGASAEAVLEGVTMVARKLHRVLEEAGLETLEPEEEPFDPNLMEAMASVPADSPDEDETVAEVFQPGFRFRGHLVRPARVSVRKHD